MRSIAARLTVGILVLGVLFGAGFLFISGEVDSFAAEVSQIRVEGFSVRGSSHDNSGIRTVVIEVDQAQGGFGEGTDVITRRVADLMRGWVLEDRADVFVIVWHAKGETRIFAFDRVDLAG